MQEISLQRFEKKDLSSLKELMHLNKEYSGICNPKFFDKFMEWHISNLDDLNWKIVITEDLKSKMIGYIGFDLAKDKETTKEKIKTNNDLFLKIYFHPSFIRKGYGEKAFFKSLEKIKPLAKDDVRIFASTYFSNVRARNFFKNKCGMSFSHYYPKYDVFVYYLDI